MTCCAYASKLGVGQGLAESDRFQILVGLDDLPQLVLRGAVAAIGIRVVTLHQRLETGLDLLDRRRSLQAEHVERLALGIADRSGLRLVGPGPSAGGAAVVPEHAERIGRAAKFGME